MGTNLPFLENNLHVYWKDTISDYLNHSLLNSKNKVLINLASNEYYKVIDQKKLMADIFTPVFLDNKNGQYRMISIYAKKARGLMTRFIIKNKIEDSELLEGFQEEGYVFNHEMSVKGKKSIHQWLIK